MVKFERLPQHLPRCIGKNYEKPQEMKWPAQTLEWVTPCTSQKRHGLNLHDEYKNFNFLFMILVFCNM
jgi:hypothetical protein